MRGCNPHLKISRSAYVTCTSKYWTSSGGSRSQPGGVFLEAECGEGTGGVVLSRWWGQSPCQLRTYSLTVIYIVLLLVLGSSTGIWGTILLFIQHNLILDIKNSISWYQEIHFLISRNAFLDIKNSISWYQEIIHISWYQKIKFLISRNHFLISRNQFLDIKKCILRHRFTIY